MLDDNELLGVVSFDVYHDYLVKIPENMREEIKADMDAEFKDFEKGYDYVMNRIFDMYEPNNPFNNEDALLIYAYHKNRWFGKYPNASWEDGGYNEDEDSFDVCVRY